MPLTKEKEMKKIYYKKLGFFSKIKLALTKPSELFEAVKDESLGSAFKFLALITLIPFLILSSPLLLFADFFLIVTVILIVYGWVLILGVSFISAGILHLFVRLFKGIGKYRNTYTAMAYSTTPLIFLPLMLLGAVLLSLVTFTVILLIYFMITAYEFIILVIGLSKLHRISKVRALASILIPAIIMLLILYLSGLLNMVLATMPKI
jgi:hypothetical protein